MNNPFAYQPDTLGPYGRAAVYYGIRTTQAINNRSADRPDTFVRDSRGAAYYGIRIPTAEEWKAMQDRISIA